MNNNFLKVSMFVLGVFFTSCTPKQSSGSSAITQFKKVIHDFKKIPKNIDVTAIFKFSNTGEVPLLIYDVKTSCGCTIPEWSKEAIAPNEEGIIKVNYDAKHFGSFSKTITVFYNGENSPQLLKIEGEVMSTKEEKDLLK